MTLSDPYSKSGKDILSVFELPIETGSRMLYEEDLAERGFLSLLEDLPEETRKTLLHHAQTLVSIKPELGYHFLFKAKALIERVGLESLEKWVALVLDIFDAGGLNPAKEFIFALDDHPLFVQHWGMGVSFHEIRGILHNYVHALSHRDFHLETGDIHHTDTLTIYVPERISTFSRKEDNALLYKIMVTHKFLQTELGTYGLNPDEIPAGTTALSSATDQVSPQENAPPLSRFLARFPDSPLAEDLFNLLETLRIEAWIEEHLPGLFREMNRLKKDLGFKRASYPHLPTKSLIMDHLINGWLTENIRPLKETDREAAAQKIRRLIRSIRSFGATVEDSAMAVMKGFGILNRIPGAYAPVETVPFVGRLKPEAAARGRLKRREATRVRFREELAKIIDELPQCEQLEIEIPGTDDLKETHGDKKPRQQIPTDLLLDGNPVPIPEAMRKGIEEILEDLGAIPSSYTTITDDMSGHSFRSLCQTPTGTSNVLSEHGAGVHVYDEWDYRRKGYRKRWVLLRESDAPMGDTAFAKETLDRYRGMIQSIKRQFERIQTSQVLLKRQKDGDRVDLDAAIEAFADGRAGLIPSERVFSQMRRDKRDIATAFLIDLSGSTKGWINDMERTALLILSEAFGVLRDRFAIYGFSGRTRKRCELFRIKGFAEPYEETVKARISGLTPLDYTRLGPPIRHLTGILGQVEAKTRLMITLSDGKPDDYDIYKGSYGIEDTRQALIESRQAGIHPFCITIDRAEHAYLSHMYGPANYVFIDDIAKLPVKIPEIYRKLTT
jgi:nitric oxide reductase NorD protein